MASAAERKRRQRARTASKTADVLDLKRANGGEAPPPAAAGPRMVEAKRTYVRRETGLTWLRARDRISAAQVVTGQRWGDLCRARELESAHKLKSCLDVADGGGGGNGKLSPGEFDYAAADAAFQAKHELALAQFALFDHEGMLIVLDSICWKGLLPSQMTSTARGVEDIVSTLRNALDLVAKHWERQAQAIKAADPPQAAAA